MLAIEVILTMSALTKKRGGLLLPVKSSASRIGDQRVSPRGPHFERIFGDDVHRVRIAHTSRERCVRLGMIFRSPKSEAYNDAAPRIFCSLMICCAEVRPVKLDSSCLLTGPTRTRSGSPPDTNASRIASFSRVSVKVRRS